MTEKMYDVFEELWRLARRQDCLSAVKGLCAVSEGGTLIRVRWITSPLIWMFMKEVLRDGGSIGPEAKFRVYSSVYMQRLAQTSRPYQQHHQAERPNRSSDQRLLLILYQPHNCHVDSG